MSDVNRRLKPTFDRVNHLIRENARMQKRIGDLEMALRRAADEPNIDRARAIADAALEAEHE